MNEKFLLLIFLIAIFSTILIYTIKPQNTKIDYDFYREIIIDNTNQKNTKIGQVILKNTGFFPVKVSLKKLKGCIFNNNSKHFSYNIYYSISKQSYKRLPGNYNKKNFIEISTKNEMITTMRLSLEFPVIENNFETKLYYEKNLKNQTLYIFNDEKEEDEYMFNQYIEFCENVNKKNAIYRVLVMN